jgi:aerobic-type carbon monoxide dehydrogenase small subunit (CoxS/CutS family)
VSFYNLLTYADRESNDQVRFEPNAAIVSTSNPTCDMQKPEFNHVPPRSLNQEAPMIPIIVNGKRHQVEVDTDTPLLWVLRENLGLTGTKFGCGIAQCGACTVHVDGQPIRSCVTQIGAVKGKRITTIEGLSPNGSHPLQKAWIAEEVPQCGYCQSGQIMSAAAMLATKPRPTDADIDAAMSGNICRCGTYQRIRRAIHRAAGTSAQGGAK